jgi:hypothetical protein
MSKFPTFSKEFLTSAELVLPRVPQTTAIKFDGSTMGIFANTHKFNETCKASSQSKSDANSRSSSTSTNSSSSTPVLPHGFNAFQLHHLAAMSRVNGGMRTSGGGISGINNNVRKFTAPRKTKTTENPDLLFDLLLGDKSKNGGEGKTLLIHFSSVLTFLIGSNNGNQ